MRPIPRSALPVALTAALALGCQGVIGDGHGPLGPPDPPGPAVLCDPAAMLTTGPTPLRRLTRTEYENTLLDLFGVRLDSEISLPVDERAGVFTSNALTPVGRLEVQQYLEAAEAAAASVDYGPLDDCNRLTTSVAECAERFVSAVGRRVYRRPLTDAERAGLIALFVSYGTDDYAQGRRLALTAMLASPAFLYHPDALVPEEGTAGAMVPLEPHALASRLSFFLFRAAPDAELLDAAEAGLLEDADGVRAEVSRMLDDPRAARGIADFHEQWLGLERLGTAVKNPVLYPSFDPALVDAMREETLTFADAVIRRGDGSLRTLLTADFSYPTGPLFDLYGIAEPPGYAEGDRVALLPGERHGILTHPSVLTAHAHVSQSSLTLRGKLVRESFFCQDLPDPPPDVDITLPEPQPGATTRERFAEHTAPPCASCHELIDEIGFGLESYDAIGAFRTMDNGVPVDASGRLTRTDVDGPFTGAAELTERLVESPEVEACVARQWFRFAFGRRETDADACTLASLDAAMEEPDDLRALLFAIAVSDGFRHRIVPTE